MAFKDRLRQLRIERKIGQGELGEILNYGATAISNYETGRNEPSIGDLIRLADFFNVSVDYLIDRANVSMSSANTHLREAVKEDVLEQIKNYLNSLK